MENVTEFAGDDLEAAVFFAEDERYLVEKEMQVAHYEVDVNLTAPE
jgi:hypothetical protein